MSIKIALAGNPNSGKTTMFNDLTGSSQRVGNWPGVTVEKKEGRLKGVPEVTIQDLPGVYSLSPYTIEEVITRNYLVNDAPDAIINIVDGSNIERNLYLTTQLLELGIPVVVALNMMDIVRKNGDSIDTKRLGETLRCEVVETSALKGEGCKLAAERAAAAARGKPEPLHEFSGAAEHAIAHIEDIIADRVPRDGLRWYAIKLFERDEKIIEELRLDRLTGDAVEKAVTNCEGEIDDDSQSIITNERYSYISRVVNDCVRKSSRNENLDTSDRIDRIVTNRILALPIFVAVMAIMYFIAVTTVGAIVTDFTNDVLFGEWIQGGLRELMEGAGVAGGLTSLVVDGIVGGVGAVIGFVPQMLVLFAFLAILEECGYMARVAFIMDRIFRKFGLSGKSFIPMLIGSGCSVPGIMASRTIESERDRRMTVMTTSFIPCGAKMPIIAMLAGSVFGGAWWIATLAYFMGVAAVVVSGIILKKTRMFSGEPSPFVMELPPYHAPTFVGVLRSMWERGWSFIKRAGTVILFASIVVWFLSSFGFMNGGLAYLDEYFDDEAIAAYEDAADGEPIPMDYSILASVGRTIAPVFKPLGFGDDWRHSVATILGLAAKEEVVGTFGVLYGIGDGALDMVEEAELDALSPIAYSFTWLSAFSFMIFNLFCAPCVAAMGAIRREMNSAKWTGFALGYLTVFAYLVSLMVYQFGLLFAGGGFGLGTVFAILALALFVYMLVRKGTQPGGSAPAGSGSRATVGASK